MYGNGWRRPDRERREHRKDLPVEDLLELAELLLLEIVDLGDDDALLRQGRLQLALPELRLLAREVERALADLGQGFPRRAPVGRAQRDSSYRLVHQARHAHHEELVEVGREDRAEVHSLEQLQAWIRGDFQDARVEIEPRKLAVEKPRVDFGAFRPHQVRIVPAESCCVGYELGSILLRRPSPVPHQPFTRRMPIAAVDGRTMRRDAVWDRDPPRG